jgi:hypothetical protein
MTEITHTGEASQCPCATFVHAYGTNRNVQYFVADNCHEGDLTCVSPEYYDRPVWPRS